MMGSMSRMSRRRALTVLAGATAGAVGVSVVFRDRARNALRWLRDAGREVAAVSLPDADPGALTPEAQAVLLALTPALVDRDLDADPYLEFFRFRAESIPGYRAIYESFARDITPLVQRSTGVSFAAATFEERRTALRELGLTPERMAVTLRAVTHRSLARYDHFVIREVLSFFSATDAWILAGYGARPGQPRTLSHYLEPAPRPET